MSASSPALPSADSAGEPPVNAAARPLLTEDEHLLSFWREEMESRLEERATLRARHRDQLEDALDHLEG
ncbi:MAG TPA: DNA translocase FtsK, partial [Rariglobus sp.]